MRGEPEFLERFRFDLTDSFSGEVVHLADLLEGQRVVVSEADTKFDDLPLTISQVAQEWLPPGDPFTPGYLDARERRA